MTNNPDFDIYPGLDRDIQAASDKVADASGLDKVVGEHLRQPGPNLEGLSKEARSWAVGELDNNFADGAMGSWQRYEEILGITVPTRTDELLQHPRMGETIQRLYEAKKALRSTGLETSAGENIGDVMHLVLVPWQAFRENLDRFQEFEENLGQIQGVDRRDGAEKVANLLTNNKNIYCDPEDPDFRMTAKEYLEHKLSRAGPWGAMLMQTSKYSGVSELNNSTPGELTDNGKSHLNLAEHNVDAMGIFEWVALTLQESPKEISPDGVSVLLATRAGNRQEWTVACGLYRGKPNINFWQSDVRVSNWQPRLAVA